MHFMVGNAADVGWVALKALLLYLTAVIGFRLGERRTLAQLSPFDFVAAVAVGAIVGRVPNAQDGTYLNGLVTLVAVLGAHAALTRLRLLPGLARAIDHPPRILVADGEPVATELRRCGLTQDDLLVILRQHGVTDLAAVRYLVFERRGQTSVIRRDGTGLAAPPGLVLPARPR
ncbi:DUF421 domain-containing protein [Paracraurococcus ruber]|uniref:YetF C-terminal domain-containing protein n=1 Tax=Paracraurococcus ruber TaxID=77675 RepID=A0ABS1CRU1_9PROT|nr:YetF domain-containing protein [Paracraurococcus ruber]MBK1657088.1 hypothetical protein [Paracraurococcus ruber]TDG33387.1 DUF421 domain-containing protein [Paracraurococcus ruber]